MTGFDIRTRRQELGGRPLLLLLLGPALLLIAAFSVYPLVNSVSLSLQEHNLLRDERSFVGLANFVRMTELPLFWRSVIVTAIFTVVSLAVQLPLGMGIALVLNRRFRGRGVLRAIVLIPWAIPTVANAALWQWIYDARFGALNGALGQLGVIDQPVAWLGETALALNAVIVADTWKVLPIYAFLLLAGLQSIPAERYESAAVDGAGPWRQFCHVTLPGLRAVLLVILVLRTIEIFRVFDVVYLLTRGGPAGHTTVIAFLAHQQSFQSLNFGLGAAIGLVIGLTTLIAAVIYLKLLHRDEEAS